MKIEKIPSDILGAVRQRLGADDENDISMDHEIEKMSAKQLIAKWSGWHLGDEDWGKEMVNKYELLKKLETE